MHSHQTISLYPGSTIEMIDIAEQNSPFYDKPEYPIMLPKDNPTPNHANGYSSGWSALISQYYGYIFITPEYNGSVPAGLKNALDYLFHEWAGKPAGIISYGNSGGIGSSAHLADLLKVFHLDIVSTKANFETPESLLPYLKTQQLRSENIKSWKESGSDKAIEAMFSEILVHL